MFFGSCGVERLQADSNKLKEIYEDDFSRYNILTPKIAEIIKNMSLYIVKL